jgi:hypothetical protein
MLMIRHRVKDYGKWRSAFDKHAEAQKSAGLTNPHIFRSANDKNESNGLASLSPFQSWPDCIINTSGYDFRKGQAVYRDRRHFRFVP